jgi:hypothetical protein
VAQGVAATQAVDEAREETLSRAWPGQAAGGHVTGLRDAAALAKLPAEEKKAFAQIWAGVAALLKKAEAKPKEPRSVVDWGEGAGLLLERAKILEIEQQIAFRASVFSTYVPKPSSPARSGPTRRAEFVSKRFRLRSS